MKKILLLLFSLGWLTAAAQDTLTIGTCYDLARQNWPLLHQLDLISWSNNLRLQNLSKNYLPQASLNVNASYQTDVTRINLNIPAQFGSLHIPEIEKDWYKATLDVSQAIYDGQVTSYNKKLEKANLAVDQTSVESELYQLKEQVNQLYFSILLLQENQKLLESNHDRLDAKLKEVRVAVNNGAALPMNADLLEAELIRNDQNIDEAKSNAKAARAMLSNLINRIVTPATVLEMPATANEMKPFENNRLENRVFELQESRLGIMHDMVTTKWNPKIYAYAQAGYGRPGLNMLDPDFTPWGVIGAKITWNFWSWNANKNEKKILNIQEDILRTRQSAFDRNLRIQAKRDLAEIEKAETALLKDTDLISLRSRITQAASSQLDHGVITSGDYITRLQEETLARLNYEIHKIELAKARLRYLYNQGKL